jgi:hypothetical protein
MAENMMLKARLRQENARYDELQAMLADELRALRCRGVAFCGRARAFPAGFGRQRRWNSGWARASARAIHTRPGTPAPGRRTQRPGIEHRCRGVAFRGALRRRSSAASAASAASPPTNLRVPDFTAPIRTAHQQAEELAVIYGEVLDAAPATPA